MAKIKWKSKSDIDKEKLEIEEKYQEIIAEREALKSIIKEGNILDILLGVD